MVAVKEKMIVKELLFTSSRTMNKNQVTYSVQYDSDTGFIYSPEPIVAEWIMYEVDGSGSTTEALTLMERELLYGPTVIKQDHSPPRVMFAITGLTDMVLTVFRKGSRFVAGVRLPSGQLGILNHVHGLMAGTLIEGLQVHATVGSGVEVQEFLPINRVMAA